MVNSISSVKVANRWSLLTTSTLASDWTSSPVTSPGPLTLTRIVRGSSPSIAKTRPLTFNTMSETSSITPGRVVNSCSAPLTRMRVTAAPSTLDSKIRRREFPTVVPKPRSNGSTEKRQNVSVRLEASGMTRAGSSSPRHLRCMVTSLSSGVPKRVVILLWVAAPHHAGDGATFFRQKRDEWFRIRRVAAWADDNRCEALGCDLQWQSRSGHWPRKR